MSANLALLGGATIGMAAGGLLVPLTRRELASAVTRSSASETAPTTMTAPAPQPVATWHRVALVAASGLLPGFVLYRVGWSIIAVPPLLLLLGLIQLAYCDFSRRLLPKTLVYAISAAVVVSGIVIAGVTHEWQRLLVASLGGLCFFAVLFMMNLANPRWMAFGDVRLSAVVGFGLAWVSPIALLEGFFLANLLASAVGLTMIGLHRADRKSAMPFGLYLAIGAGIIIMAWS
jgi:leader peptidase (prepilin peptidase)/N-methyltransferase